MNILTSTGATRASSPGVDPEVGKVVANASGLAQDLQAVTELQNQLSRVATAASQDAQNTMVDPSATLNKLCGHMKELVCSYVYLYDATLSPSSETPSVQTATPVDYEKDPAKLLSAIRNPLTVPALPGNLFQLACGDDSLGLQEYNYDLYTLLNDSSFQALYEGTTDAQKVAACIPRYAIPRAQSDPEIPDALKQRWADLLTLNAADQVVNGVQTVHTEADEVIAIAGLQTLADYQAFTALRLLDQILKDINYTYADQLISAYQWASGNPLHQGIWLARGVKALGGTSTIMDALVGYLSDRRPASEFHADQLASGFETQALWEWLASPIVGGAPPSAEVEANPVLKAIETASIAYVGTLRAALLSSLGSTQATMVSRFNSWHNTLAQRGGILGFEAIALVAALTALERVRVAASLNRSEAEIAGYAADGLRLAGYVSNAGPLQDAFQALGV